MLLGFPQRISAVFVALPTYPATYQSVSVAVRRYQATGDAELAAFAGDFGLLLHTPTMPWETDNFALQSACR